MKQKVCFKFVYIKKVIAVLVITMMLGILLSGFFTGIYKPYITSMAVGRTNNLMQNLMNKTVLEIISSKEFDSFVNIIKDNDNKIVGIETDTVKVNEFKSVFLSSITEKIKNLQNERFGIPVLSFLNNPFLSEIGPVIHIKLKPVGIINADLKSTFESVGVNQSKHQIDLKFNINVVIVMPAIQIKHTVSSTVPVAQTVIVGEVPQSYTNVTTSPQKLDDTVLQLAEN
ncbi:MAG: sporulation protein YunB [Clostridia bacterium]|nr:sporulation protein YunB [Clostridia bacterium]